MNETYVVLALIWTHFIADFLLQNDEMAIKKSKDNQMLACHSIFYGIPFIWLGPLFLIITWILHFLVDYVSSRATSRLWTAGERHWFFCVIGFDQAIHLTILIATYLFVREFPI
jgi:hypothetical protein